MKYWRLMMKVLKSIKHRWYAEWKPWLLKCWRLVKKIFKFIKYFWADVNHRRCSLVGAGILGIGLAFFIYPDYIYDLINSYSSINNILHNGILHNSITILFLGLPIFYTLWKFRTHDIQKQIAKTEENTNNSTFFECARMLTEEKSAEGKSIQQDSLSKKTALEQLAYLKKETGFDKNRIGSLTRGLYLKGKNFNFARFSGLDLSIANLNEAKLAHAELTGTKLTVANLSGADLSGTDLTEAKLNGADLTGAKLNKAILIDAELIMAKLVGAKLNEANLSGAKLNGAKLVQADLTDANLRKANLTDADLTGAKLNGIKLTGVKLIKADLTGVDLKDTDLRIAIYDGDTEFNGTILEDKEMRDKAGMIYRPDESA